MTKAVIGENGTVKALRCVRVDGKMQEVPGSEFDLRADLVLLAMGFVSPVHEGMIKELGVALDARGNVQADTLAYGPRSTRCSPPATCAAASRWWSGRSAKAARRRARSIIS